MQPLRPSPAARRRQEDEAANRRRTRSLRVGTAGIVLLFAGGLLIVFSPISAWWLLGIMAVGLGLIIVAFLLIRTPMTDSLRIPLEK